MGNHILLKELLSDHYSADKDACWLKFMSNTGIVIFWSELGGANRNIATLRHQKLPIIIEVSDLGECLPSDYEKKKYKAAWSIPSQVSISIDSSIEA
jgi:hypothetical protein